MKNLLKKIIIAVIAFSSVTGPVFAGNTALIVKQDGAKVYLDTSEFKPKPKPGYVFTVTERGEDIINPKTGKKLGKDIKRRINGEINLVEEGYSIGTLKEEAKVLGLEAEITAPEVTPAPAIQNTVAADAAGQNSAVINPVWQSADIEGKAKAAAAGNITGAGNELALVFDDNTINIFTLENNALKNILTHQVTPLRNIISLDAADIKNTGKAQLFAVVYDSAAERFSTLVFEYNNAALEQTGIINGIVKGIAPLNGPRVLYMQEILQNSGKPLFTTPAKLVYKNGFGKGEKLNAHRLESVFGFNMADFKNNGKQNTVYTAYSRKLRVQFDKKNAFVESPADIDFATTPIRIKFRNSVIRAHLPIALFKNAQGNIILAAAEHESKLGILSDAFGSYSGGKLYFLKWTGNSLAKYGEADLGGVAYDIIQAPLGDMENIIIIPVASDAGSTRVLVFDAK